MSRAIVDVTQLEVGRIYGRREDVVSELDARSCASLTGEACADGDAPLGLSFVWALRTLIGAGFLPGGAVMSRHSAEWLRRVKVGERIVTDVIVSSVERDRGRARLRYRSTDEQQDIVVVQEQEAIWPRSA